MKGIKLINSSFAFAAFLSVMSTSAFAEQCYRERVAMEGTAENARAICSGGNSVEDCQIAFEAFEMYAERYEQCLASREDSAAGL